MFFYMTNFLHSLATQQVAKRNFQQSFDEFIKQEEVLPEAMDLSGEQTPPHSSNSPQSENG